MPQLVDRYGHIIAADRPETSEFKRRRSPAALDVKTGDQFGTWAGRDAGYYTLPGGAMLQFDLSRLTLADFRSMRDHYQLNASLTVLSFVLHAIDWHIECDDKEIADMIEENLRDIWTPLVRALSQAFWAGYSPNVLNFENDIDTGYVIIDRVKDLIPEESRVHWKKVKGYAPPNHIAPALLQYDGIDHYPMGGYEQNLGAGKGAHIPPENTLWYPLLMENGNYYGRHLLRPAFPAWYFSQLIHLFANRYYERFGEPVPIGRSNFDDEVDTGNGTMTDGKTAMESILTSLRNRSVVVLPSDRDPVTKEYDYSIEYLESQMRGADFERYMARLDEEMSLAIFTPVLLFRTSNVGSYNLGQAHLKIFLWMLNSVAGDIQYFIQRYIVNRLHDINFGPRAPKARWVYRSLGKDETLVLSHIANQVITGGIAKPDLEELSTALGLTFTEVKQVTAPPAAPVDPNAPGADKPVPGVPKPTVPGGGAASAPGRQQIAPRTTNKVAASYPNDLADARAHLYEGLQRAYTTLARGNQVDAIGYRNRVMQAFKAAGADGETANQLTGQIYDRLNGLLPEYTESLTPDRFREVFGRVIDLTLEEVVEA